MKKYTRFAALLFGLGAVVHAYRLYAQFQVIIGNHKMPVMLSWFFVLAGFILCFGLWHESKTQ